jgi:hypothetical protein
MTQITMEALVKRINRKLAHKREQLKKTRGADAWNDVGDYFVLDVERNLIVVTHLNPENLGRELGVLKRTETVKNS